jgi:hypothetical protein
MNRRLSTRQPVIAIAAIVGLLCIRAAPSEVPELDYEIHFIGPITEAGEKYLIEGLLDQDPGIQFWIDRPTQSALARTEVHLDRTVLQAAISPSGLVIGYMGTLSPHQEVSPERSTTGTFPVYIDTGHPAVDGSDYLNAKAAWFAAHSPVTSPLTDQ